MQYEVLAIPQQAADVGAQRFGFRAGNDASVTAHDRDLAYAPGVQ
jgi:hypothetical protein